MEKLMKKIEAFNSWMEKIGNIFYSDYDKMLEAYKRLEV